MSRDVEKLGQLGSSAAGPDGAGFTRVSRGLLSDEVVKEVQRLLATKMLRPGDQLPPERDLGETLGVSRTVVRDAVQRLAALGILEIRRGRGTFVREAQYLALSGPLILGPQISREEVLMVLEARSCLDVFLAGLAAERATVDDLRALEHHINEAEDGPQAAKAHYAPDLGFEALIGKAARNPFLQKLQSQAHAAYMTTWDAIGFIPWPFDERQTQHKRVFTAIKRRDAAAARHAMSDHLDIRKKLGNAQ